MNSSSKRRSLLWISNLPLRNTDGSDLVEADVIKLVATFGIVAEIELYEPGEAKDILPPRIRRPDPTSTEQYQIALVQFDEPDDAVVAARNLDRFVLQSRCEIVCGTILMYFFGFVSVNAVRFRI